MRPSTTSLFNVTNVDNDFIAIAWELKNLSSKMTSKKFGTATTVFNKLDSSMLCVLRIEFPFHSFHSFSRFIYVPTLSNATNVTAINFSHNSHTLNLVDD